MWNLAVCVALALYSAYGYDLESFPAPHTKNNRVMGFILSYYHNHIDPLVQILNEYVSMCEGGWDPTVVIFTTVNWTDTMHRYMRQRTYCYRTQTSVPIRLSVHDPTVSTGLSMYHKPVLKKEIDNFDFFVYHEDDMMFKHSHLVAYINETRKLAELDPQTGLHNNVIGFQRYRQLFRGGDLSAPYGENDIFESEMLEEVSTHTPICFHNEPYLHLSGNTHQAIWAFTSMQIKILQEKCSFMDLMNASREYMSSFSVFDRKICGMTKLIPAERFSTFAILHYYHQRHVSWVGVFATDESIRSNTGVPDCWAEIVKRTRAEMGLP